MQPVIFKFYGIEARSYYLLWAFALLLFLLLSYHRCVGKYGLEPESARDVLLWVYLTAILGAFAGVVIEKLPLVLMGRESWKILFSGGSSACFGILIGGATGIWQLRKNKIPVADFADAVAIPLSLMLCIGRIGCLLEGCCAGKAIVDCRYALHFPNEPEFVRRFPSQPAEALALGIITLILVYVEKKCRQKFRGALLFPLFMLMYGSYRLYFDRFRELPVQRAFHGGYVLSAVAVTAGAVWLATTLKNKTA